MSDRWTISTYLDGEIVDIRYYKNWSKENLFYEAVAVMSLFVDCKNEDDYWTMVCRSLPEGRKGGFRLGKRLLHEIEKESEFPVVVDLSLKKIYLSFCAARNKDLLVIHEAGKPYETTEEYLRYAIRKGGYRWLYMTQAKRKRDIRAEIASARQDNLPLPLTDEQITPSNIDVIIEHYKISFDRKTIQTIRTVFREEPSMKAHLSHEVAELINTYF